MNLSEPARSLVPFLGLPVLSVLARQQRPWATAEVADAVWATVPGLSGLHRIEHWERPVDELRRCVWVWSGNGRDVLAFDPDDWAAHRARRDPIAESAGARCTSRW